MWLATDEEGLSKEVAMALSQEMLEDADSGRSARYVDVTSDGAPPTEEIISRLMEVPPDQAAVAAEEPEPVSSPPEPVAPSGSLPSGSPAYGTV